MEVYRIVNIAAESVMALVLVVLLIGLIVSKGRNDKLNRLFLFMLVCNLLMLLSDTFSWALYGTTFTYTLWMQRISNFCIFFFMILYMLSMNMYFFVYIPMKIKTAVVYKSVVGFLCLTSLILLIIAQFNGMYYNFDSSYMFHRGDLFWVAYLPPLFLFVTDMVMVLHHRHLLEGGKVILLMIYILLPLVGAMFQFYFFGIMFIYLAMALVLIMFYVRVHLEQEQNLAQKERELKDSAVAMMLSQIQPHFLYNSLAAIRELCHIDPEVASQTIEEFARYLRANLESLSIKNPVSVEQELRHVETYLLIEKQRFGSKLNILYSIEEKGFKVPVLTVQPIVENAVRHGVTKRRDGGTITIGTKRTESDFIITVTDDGIGFDSEGLSDDGRLHTGIANVRMRLQSMCNGTLEIESRKGQGTTAIITIPKGGRGV